MSTNEEKNTSQDVTSAEAELKAAFEALDAAKARLAELKVEHPASQTDASATSEAPTESAAPEAIVLDAVPVESASATPPGKTDEKVTTPQQVPATSASVDAPTDWVPYTTNPAGAPAQAPAAAQGYAPPAPGQGYYQQPQPQQPPAGYAAPSNGQPPHAGPGAVPPQQPYYGYQQPYYQPPYQQQLVSSKDHVAAGLLAIFLGALGIHKFYLGYNTAGFIMLAVTIIGSIITFGLAAGVMSIISIIEGILYLTKSQSEFEQTYVVAKREWF